LRWTSPAVEAAEAAADHAAVRHIGEGIPEPDEVDTLVEGIGNRGAASGTLAEGNLGAAPGTLEEGNRGAAPDILAEGTHTMVAEDIRLLSSAGLLAEVVEGILSNQFKKNKLPC